MSNNNRNPPSDALLVLIVILIGSFLVGAGGMGLFLAYNTYISALSLVVGFIATAVAFYHISAIAGNQNK